MSSIPKAVQDRFTREGSLAVETAADAKRYVAAAGKFSQETGERESHVGVVAAYATHAAMRTGYLGGSDGVTQDEYAALFGRSKSAVTLWKRLAVAFVDLGIDPESDLGRVLRTGANKGPIAKAIMAEEATEADVRKVAEEVYQSATDGTLTAKAKPVTREGAVSNGSDKMPEVPRNDSTRLDLIEACLAALSNGDVTPGIAKRLGEISETLTALMERKVAQTA